MLTELRRIVNALVGIGANVLRNTILFFFGGLLLVIAAAACFEPRTAVWIVPAIVLTQLGLVFWYLVYRHPVFAAGVAATKDKWKLTGKVWEFVKVLGYAALIELFIGLYFAVVPVSSDPRLALLLVVLIAIYIGLLIGGFDKKRWYYKAAVWGLVAITTIFLLGGWNKTVAKVEEVRKEGLGSLKIPTGPQLTAQGYQLCGDGDRNLPVGETIITPDPNCRSGWIAVPGTVDGKPATYRVATANWIEVVFIDGSRYRFTKDERVNFGLRHSIFRIRGEGAVTVTVVPKEPVTITAVAGS